MRSFSTCGSGDCIFFADPLFVDPDNGDYRLQPDSPAHALGFESFATDQFGLLPEFVAWEEDRHAAKDSIGKTSEND